MKITVNPDGSFELDVQQGDSATALEFINEVTGASVKKKVNESRSASLTLAAEKVEGSNLNKLQYITWEFLVENDTANGIHVSFLARQFGILQTTANSRLLTLEQKGYAKRVAKGYYRAILKEG